MKTICFMILALFFTIVSYAQQTVSIHFVDAELGEGIPAVNLYPKEDFRKGVSADNNGRLTLESDFINQYGQWIASSVGYEKLKLQKSQLLKGGRVILSSQKKALEEVVIEADRMVAEEFTVETINQIEIYTNPSANADPLLAVNTMPSSTTTDESASISLRGSSPLETGIFFNGVPIYNAVKFAQLNGIGTFSIFNTNLIDEVHVFPGNPPLEYGNVSSGMIALETSNTFAPVSQTQIIASLASFGIAHSQPLGEKAGLTLFSNYQPSGLIKGLNSEALDEIESFNSLDAGVYLHIKPGKRFTLKSFIYGLQESYQFNFRSPSFQGLLDQNAGRLFTVNNLVYQWGDQSISINTGHGANAIGYQFSQFDIEQPEQYAYYNLNYQLSKERWDLKTGVSFDQQRYNFSGVYPRYSYAMGPNHPAMEDAYHRKITIPEAYVYWKRYLSKKLILGTGYRKSLGKVEEEDYLGRQFNAFYKPNDRWEFIFGVGDYHRTIVDRNTLETIFFDSEQISIDAKWSRANNSAQVSLFHKKTTRNQVSQELAGVELFADLKISNRLQSTLSFTYLHGFNNHEHEARSMQWDNSVNYFARWETAFDAGHGWRVNSILNVREGNGYFEVEDAIFNAGLQAFEPDFSRARSQFLPYRNFSLSVSKIQPIGESMSLVVFANMNNVFDFKNSRDIIFNEDYSQSEKANFSRRLVYLGFSVNF